MPKYGYEIGGGSEHLLNVLNGKSYVNQLPIGTGYLNAINITFGAGGTSSDGRLSLASNGEITILQGGKQYQVEVNLRVGRSTTPGNSVLVGWYEVDILGDGSWVAGGDPQVISMDVDDIATRQIAFFTIQPELPTGAKLRIRFARSEQGVNDGGLYAHSFTGSSFDGILTDAPSATVDFVKMV